MAAISSNVIQKTRGDVTESLLVLEGVTTHKGAFIKGNGETHGTSAHQGRVEDYDTDNGGIPLGLADIGKTGDESEVVEEVVSLESAILEQVTVTGVTGQADVFKRAYWTNNNPNDLTLTKPDAVGGWGVIVRYHSGTTCDVIQPSFLGMYIASLGGGGADLMALGSFDVTIAASANLATGLVAPYHGRFTDFYAVIDGADLVGASGDVDINLEIGGTNVTGGVISLLIGAPTAGTKVAGTAITAANTFHAGDLIDIEAVVNTAFTTGRVNLYATVEKLPGL